MLPAAHKSTPYETEDLGRTCTPSICACLLVAGEIDGVQKMVCVVGAGV
jgi:hypothetical protein